MSPEFFTKECSLREFFKKAATITVKTVVKSVGALYVAEKAVEILEPKSEGATPTEMAAVLNRPKQAPVSASFNPQTDVTSATLLMWWEARQQCYVDAGVTPVTNASLVGLVRNMVSPGTYDLAQTTAGSKPTWYSATIGVPSIYFDGTKVLTVTPPAISQPFTFFSCGTYGTNTYASIFQNGVSTRRFTSSQLHWGAELAADSVNKPLFVYSAVVNTTTVVWSNTTQIASGNAGTSGVSASASTIYSGGNPTTGHLTVMLLYSGAISSPERTSVINYIKGVSGL